MVPDDLERMRSRAPQGTFRFKTIPQGAATTVWCATSPELDRVGGVYCEDCHVSEGVASAETLGAGHAPWAYDEEQAARLWEWSEGEVGERFPLV